jgi:hypothetical protein
MRQDSTVIVVKVEVVGGKIYGSDMTVWSV